MKKKKCFGDLVCEEYNSWLKVKIMHIVTINPPTAVLNKPYNEIKY